MKLSCGMRALWGIVLVLAVVRARGADAQQAASRLAIGIVQLAPAATLAENRDQILAGLETAAAGGARVVVFPEAALRGGEGESAAAAHRALAAIGERAKKRNVYALFGGLTVLTAGAAPTNWARLIGPDGRELFYYEKLYAHHEARMPGVFTIDGVPCAAMICADRWLRGVAEIPVQEGAQVVFELADNFADEWVAPFGWYWNQPQARRNTVWVVVANSGETARSAAGPASHHGHSAVIAPDGTVAAAAAGAEESIVQARIEVAQATRRAAIRRASAPALHAFWQAGIAAQEGHTINAPALPPLDGRETTLTLAAARTAGQISEVEGVIATAHARGADLVAFPARAIAEEELPQVCAAARRYTITVVCGAAHHTDVGTFDSAYVVGPDGRVLTRYDRISATAPFLPGADLHASWFTVKGVPAVVTIARDGLWTEVSELAAIAGAQVHVHLDCVADTSAVAVQRRLQVYANLASYQTFTVIANTAESMIWDDLRSAEEIKAAVHGRPPPDTGAVEVYSPFSANLVARSTVPKELVIATRRVPARNTYHPRLTSTLNPQMDAWYRLGGNLIRGSLTRSNSTDQRENAGKQ